MTTTAPQADAGRLAAIEQRLRALEDAEAIRNLKARYAAYCDAQYDCDGIAALFTEDGVRRACRTENGPQPVLRGQVGLRGEAPVCLVPALRVAAPERQSHFGSSIGQTVRECEVLVEGGRRGGHPRHSSAGLNAGAVREAAPSRLMTCVGSSGQ